jgi:hypothetical protein
MKKWLSLEAPGTRSARAGLYGFTSGDAADQEATQADYDRIARIALDCIPAARRTVLRVVATLTTVAAETLSTTTVAQTAQYSTAAVRRALEDL